MNNGYPMPADTSPRSPTRRRLARTLLSLALAPAVWPLALRAQSRGIVGARAPELDVDFWIDRDGKPTTFSIDAQRGKWVHLKCWQGWCPGCRKHGFPALKALTDAFADEPRVVNVAVQTVFEGRSFNTADKVRATQMQYELPIVFGHDPGTRNDSGYPNTMRSYRTGGTPWHIFIDPQGTVIFNGFSIDPAQAIEYLRHQLAQPA